MSETTEIEKKNLEAHVELCAERYRHLETKLQAVENKLEGVQTVIREVHDMLADLASKRNDQVISWAGALLMILLGVIGYLLAVYVIN